jgi:hypothetical protein
LDEYLFFICKSKKRLTLACFEARVGFVDYIETTFAADDFAIGMTDF